MMKLSIRALQLSLAALSVFTVTACGTAPAPALKSVPRLRAPVAMPAPQALGPQTAEGQFLRDAVARALTEAKGFEVELKSYSEGYYKKGERQSELRTSSSRTKLILIKPNKLRGEIIETTNPLLEGGKIATQDGLNITARAKGILGLFPLHFKATDPTLRNNRNHHFTEGSPETLLARLTAPGSLWTVVGDSVVEGTPVKLVAVDQVQRPDREITREVLGVDPVTRQVRKMIMYAGAKRVMEFTIVKFRWNPTVSADTFKL